MNNGARWREKSSKRRIGWIAEIDKGRDREREKSRGWKGVVSPDTFDY